ncbi:sulfotransferase [Hydrocarboniphaga sp.]|uniref:sulfotransferase n=1 Tax=Hydrocarboniphaga sp. TaxID=2033016 RepID=UPI003D09E51A
MKLPQAFVRLPLRFDVARLAAEVKALPPEAWSSHPTGYKGNSAVRLITLDGGENDAMTGGEMRPTRHLMASPYLQQVLQSLNTVWSRSRLMKLAPGATVPEHADINYHWFKRVRVHIPILTTPEVKFYCGQDVVHMAAGESWIFDNWRPHRVENNSASDRVHLVADTTGSAAFWNLASAGLRAEAFRDVQFQPGRNVRLLLERFNVSKVMHPAEMEQLMSDLAQEAVPQAAEAVPRVALFQHLLESFCSNWRQLWCLHGDTDAGLAQYEQLMTELGQAIAPIAEGLAVHANGTPVAKVMNARLQYAINLPEDQAPRLESPRNASSSSRVAPVPVFERPIFIVAAPRSGSTLLFETLACTTQLWTVGGEAHWLVEGIDQLAPGAPGIDSNRLLAAHATPEISALIKSRLAQKLINQGATVLPDMFRSLEKTPKNSLRIPFFNEIFPDALFVFLWRDPRENVSSIIEAWKSGGWITYPRLPQWQGPWSLLLPPGWQSMRNQPLAEIAAFQWDSTNRIIMDDLSAIDPQRVLTVNYAELLQSPGMTIQRICSFAGLQFDAELKQRTTRPLPSSKHTLTPPAPDKWLSNSGSIVPILHKLEQTWSRLRALG